MWGARLFPLLSPADGRVFPRRDELLSSGFWAASAGVCRAAAAGGGGGREPLGSGPAWRCVCYGLGRFAACPTARLQLAFLLLLLEMLAVSGHCACTARVSSHVPLSARVPVPRTSVPLRCHPAAASSSTRPSQSWSWQRWRHWGCVCSQRMR